MVKGIMSKILVIIGGSFLIMMVATGIFISHYCGNAFLNDQKDILEQTDALVSEQVNHYFSRYVSIVQTLAAEKDVKDIVQAGIPDGKINENPLFSNVLSTLKNTKLLEDETIQTTNVANLGSNVLFDSDGWISSEDPNYDVTKREWYQAVVQKAPVITEPYEDAVLKNQVVTVAAPVWNQAGDQIPGAALVDIEISKLTKMVNSQKIGKTGSYILCSAKNKVVSHSNKDMVLKNLSETGVGQNMMDAINSGNTSIIEYENNGVSCIGNYTPIGDTGWKLISSYPQSEFYSHVNRTKQVMITTYLVCMIIMLGLLVFLARIITKPIRQLNQVTNRLAEGELDLEIDVHSNDEMGQLAISLDKLIQRLKEYIAYINEITEALLRFANGDLKIELQNAYDGDFNRIKTALLQVSKNFNHTIGQISAVSGEVDRHAQQVSNASQSLAENVSEQASFLEELSANITDISNQVEETASSAQTATTATMEAGGQLERCNEEMQQLIIAMHQINSSSTEIEKIIRTIEDIAFQTNILALNAAVEAARAGTAGKGFAVVADEVRNLAAKSAEAAKNTTSLIERSLRTVEGGTALADKTAASLQDTVASAKTVVELVTRISKASAQQAGSIREIMVGSEQISGIVQENAASVEESASISQRLSQQATVLKRQVDNFRVE